LIFKWIQIGYFWCKWVQAFAQVGHVGIKVNEYEFIFPNKKRGLRQGDPLSSILFNIVADMLAIIISRAKDAGQVKGVVPHLVEDGLSILQYGDDSVIFMDHDIEKAKNMKQLLCIFIRVKSSTSDKHNNLKRNILDCLVAD